MVTLSFQFTLSHIKLLNLAMQVVELCFSTIVFNEPNYLSTSYSLYLFKGFIPLFTLSYNKNFGNFKLGLCLRSLNIYLQFITFSIETLNPIDFETLLINVIEKSFCCYEEKISFPTNFNRFRIFFELLAISSKFTKISQFLHQSIKKLAASFCNDLVFLKYWFRSLIHVYHIITVHKDITDKV